MNTAIFSPNKNPYSETFIQAHKNYLKGEVFYYYGAKGRLQLEGSNRLVSKSKLWRFRFIRKLNKYPFSYIKEQSVLTSLKKNDIDVVLVEYGSHAYNLLSLLKASGLPVVVHFHGYDASVELVIEQCNQYKEVFSLATKVIAVSRKMKQMLLELGCPSEKLIYNVYGPQPEFEKVQVNFSKKQFIGIGRFTDKKAPYYTIMAFKDVVSKHPDATLLLAGDGILLNMCQNLVKHYGLEKQVQFLGVITPERYREILSESLAFIQHSITAANGDMEGTPVAVLEASISGLPVIATKHAGIPDVIVHGETGLLCEEHDVGMMSMNMLKLLDSADYAKQLGTAGKAHILASYNMKRHIQVLQDILEVAIEDSTL
ncbi:glycosyltransferase [Winogradskyella immobilis]|uniref:Glycosyltransferase n=1 Tax=Winogradskyella immobilis TaxID=2816852 RepID=A0ABS8EQ05_9FLAO|nr:glycosyltransferase [Winogradskyella immobilis]MCC1484912.1 glycosyltransferase [Winogradskyella immobilis]MCG0017004.1 glycosyltransferase [Winogradskyella immobilis]